MNRLHTDHCYYNVQTVVCAGVANHNQYKKKTFSEANTSEYLEIIADIFH